MSFVGRAAVEAQNLFYYLTYPGCINLETLDDANLKKVCYEEKGCAFTVLRTD